MERDFLTPAAPQSEDTRVPTKSAVQTGPRQAEERLLFAGLADVCDVGEKVVPLCFRHRLAQLFGFFKHPNQDLQAE